MTGTYNLEWQDDNMDTDTLRNPSASSSLFVEPFDSFGQQEGSAGGAVAGGMMLEEEAVWSLLICALLACEGVKPGPGAKMGPGHKFNEPTAWVLRV